jgi:hypothetical protein
MAEVAAREQPDDLTSEQRERLVLFGEVTGNVCSADAASTLLASVNWDVEQAVHLHLASDNPLRPSAPPQHPPARRRGLSALWEPPLRSA